MPGGRPNGYNFELCEEICEKVARGGHIIKVLESDERYPSWDTFRRWKNENAELSALYVNSIRDKSEACTLEITTLMEEVKQGKIDAQAGRLLIDTLKWFAAKFYPKMYGDRQNIDHTTDGEKIQSTSIDVTKLPTEVLDQLRKAASGDKPE